MMYSVHRKALKRVFYLFVIIIIVIVKLETKVTISRLVTTLLIELKTCDLFFLQILAFRNPNVTSVIIYIDWSRVRHYRSSRTFSSRW